MRRALIPGPNHPIEIEPLGREITVTVNGIVVAASAKALLLREADYPPVIYIPREDIRMELLTRSTHSTHCPYKGDASYYSVPSGGHRSREAAWTYESPFDAVKLIQNHLAFHPDRVDSIA